MSDVVLFKLVFEMLRHLRPTAEVVNDYMRCERRLGGADGPHVDMMHLLYMLFGCEFCHRPTPASTSTKTKLRMMDRMKMPFSDCAGAE